jgi:hypothetical protein
MKVTAQTKVDEIRWFQMFQRASDACPQSELIQPKEPAPDIILPAPKLGIEITEYLLGQGRGASPMRRLETVRRKIVHDAQISYERREVRCIQVTVIWANLDCPNTDEQKHIAAAITRLVSCLDWRRQQIWRVHWEEFAESTLQRYVDTISACLVGEEGNSCWSSSASIWAGEAKERLQRALNEKESKVSQYRRFCREIWLLIVANKEWLCSMYFHDAAASNDVFSSSFDRAFLLDERTAAVFELRLHAAA